MPIRFLKTKNWKLKTRSNGFIALITVILIGALLLIIGLSAAFTGQTEIILAGQTDRSTAARMLAQACVDEALHRLKRDSGYAGGTVPIGVDTCTVSVTGGGSSRTIISTAASDIFTKVLTITASLAQNTAGNAKAWHVDTWTESDPP